jgi:hypothetical protein
MKTKDLTKFIVNYWIRKENRERLTLLQLQKKEREQLSRIQRRRRNDLKKLFNIEIPDRDIVPTSKREKRGPQYSIEPKSKRQKVNREEQETVVNRGFWRSILCCFRK